MKTLIIILLIAVTALFGAVGYMLYQNPEGSTKKQVDKLTEDVAIFRTETNLNFDTLKISQKEHSIKLDSSLKKLFKIQLKQDEFNLNADTLRAEHKAIYNKLNDISGTNDNLLFQVFKILRK